jgi:hypothetical protein
MKTLLYSLLLAAAAAAPAAESPSLTGSWKVHSSIGGYENDLECAFTQTDRQLAGSCKGEQGSLAITGEVADKKVTFQYKTQYNGEDLTVVHTGTLESAAKIVGTVDAQPMGVAGEFTAIQAK